ncbi:hypothetical protein DM39_6463 [Burkholderia cenocepacia]|uniref:Tetratricopeptide repeat protein n=1 Tax=Burkholderia cenocepacia TaxID=95486 RepID=A0AAN0RLX5_9BURK|nr:hypothetical protein DM39_6463 [Burkholderia cenocepacia]
MAELDNELYERIAALSDAGDALAEDEDYAGALAKYRDAFDLLPEPKTNWEAATWLLAAIGDAHFFQQDYTAGATPSVMRCTARARSAIRFCICGSGSASSNSINSTVPRTN